MEFAIYLLGVILFSASYPQIQAKLGSGFQFVVFTVAYLVVVRLIGYGFRRYIASKEADSDAG